MEKVGEKRRAPRVVPFLAALAAALAACQPVPIGLGGITYGDYTVLAWNDQGVQAINPSYDQAMILPLSNNLRAQVVKRGNPPRIVTSGITVSYSIQGNTDTYSKTGYAVFWDTIAPQLVTPAPAHNIGLTGNGLSGVMTLNATRFEATGIPVSPYLDSGVWNPYQTGVVTVTDQAGTVLATTQVTIPVSDEMHCSDCHGATGTFANILSSHTTLSGSPGTPPVICSSCHADPAYGRPGTAGVLSLSQAIHQFHSTVATPPTCYQCHPGPLTQFSRSTRHTDVNGNCTTCHGTLAQVASSQVSGRTPWVSEPACVSCHAGVAEVDTGAALSKDSVGHGGASCSACHGSPHAQVPDNEVPGYPSVDSYQLLQYQGFTVRVKSLGSCGVCHASSRGGGGGLAFAQIHGGAAPVQINGCSACHTVVPSDTQGWPHVYQWKNSNPPGTPGIFGP